MITQAAQAYFTSYLERLNAISSVARSLKCDDLAARIDRMIEDERKRHERFMRDARLREGKLLSESDYASIKAGVWP